MLSDLLLVFYVWFTLLLLQLLVAPFVIFFTKKRLRDAGWAFNKIIAWLLLSLIIWFLAHLGIPINQRAGIFFTIIALATGSFKFFTSHKKEILSSIKKAKKFILIEEALFLFGLLFLSYVRGFNPHILDLEKFMDAGFMVSYMKSPTLPVADMWLAGETINYYTFGHFLGSIMVQIWGLDMAYSYNLLLAVMMGLVLSHSFSVVINLLSPVVKKKHGDKPLLVAGFLGSYLSTFAGNTHTIWYFLKNLSFKGYWYPDATRFIENTIHEFPAYSFVVSDLHAHLWSLPIVLLLIISIFMWLKELLKLAKGKDKFTYLKFAAFLGVLFGIFLMTSAWDLAIYGLFMAVLGIILLLVTRDIQIFVKLFLSAVVIVITLLVVSSFWWLNFESISEGIALVTQRSPIWQLFVLWFGHVILSSLALLFAFLQLKLKKIKQTDFQYLLVIGCVLTAWILLVLPEIFYVKDIYPNHPRANTMFKLTYQAFVLMGLAVAWFAGFLQLREKFARSLRLFLTLILVIMVTVISIYPYFSYRDYYGAFKNRKSLDGLAWFKEQHPNDYLATMWLKDNVKEQVNIVEAVGESYTTFARVSTFSGLPTVLGWRVHEWLWRGGFDIPGKRTVEVQAIYEQPGSEQAQRVLNQYQVKYIFVGDKEREAYERIDEEGIKELGKPVFSSGTTFIIQLDL